MHTWGNQLVTVKLSDTLHIQYRYNEPVHEEVSRQKNFFWQSDCFANLAILYGLCILDSSFLYWPLKKMAKFSNKWGVSNKHCLFQFSFKLCSFYFHFVHGLTQKVWEACNKTAEEQHMLSWICMLKQWNRRRVFEDNLGISFLIYPKVCRWGRGAVYCFHVCHSVMPWFWLHFRSISWEQIDGIWPNIE